MKATTIFAITALTLGGVACSEAADSAEGTETAEIVSAPQTGDEPQGTFNLSLPDSVDDGNDTGGFNLSLGDEGADDGLLVGTDSLSSGDLGTDVPDVAIPNSDDDLNIGLEDAPATESTAEDDGIIRIDPK